MNDEPVISIIVPVYNVEKYVRRCLSSLIKQRYKNLEIIVVDDGSTDGSKKICDEFAKIDKRVKVYHKENGGLSSARNYGLRKMKGELVAFVDSDDYVNQDFVKKMYEKMVVDDADIVICGYNNDIPGEKVISGKQSTISLLIKQENIEILAWNKLYKRELFAKNEISFPVGKIHEDVLTTYKLLSKARKVAYLSDSLYVYVDRKESITNVEKIEERLKIREDAAIEAVDYFKNDTDLRQAAEISLLWAKYNYLNYAIRGGVDKKYEKKTLEWLKNNVPKYKHNRYLSRKLKTYNILSTKFGGVGYKLLKKI